MGLKIHGCTVTPIKSGFGPSQPTTLRRTWIPVRERRGAQVVISCCRRMCGGRGERFDPSSANQEASEAVTAVSGVLLGTCGFRVVSQTTSPNRPPRAHEDRANTSFFTTPTTNKLCPCGRSTLVSDFRGESARSRSLAFSSHSNSPWCPCVSSS